MKQIIFSLLLLLTAITASAQAPKANDLKERLFDAKVREMVYYLHITDEQKPHFVPIYRRYSDEMRTVFNDPTRSSQPSTAKEAAEMQKQRMIRQQKAQTIRMKYIDEFATVLNASQLNRFFEVESKIQLKLKARLDKSRRR